ncbi:hypothetical protein V8D89_015433 [Ganoderma adspersum]
MALKFLLISIAFSSFLIPTAVVLRLFVFSTPILRRRPTFILNVCAICFGLTQGTIAAYVTGIREMVLMPPNLALDICHHRPLHRRIDMRPNDYSPPGPRCISPTPVPAILPLCGVWAIDRVEGGAGRQCRLPPYTAQSSHSGPRTVMSESAAVWSSPFAKSELFLLLVDDVHGASPWAARAICTDDLSRYMSVTAFLLRIRVHTGVKFNGKQPAQRSPEAPTPRIRTLFWIARSNFMFPVIIFDVAHWLALVFRDSSCIEGGYIISVNSYVSFLGVLSSTIWSGSSRMGETPLARCAPPPLPATVSPELNVWFDLNKTDANNLSEENSANGAKLVRPSCAHLPSEAKAEASFALVLYCGMFGGVE